MRSKNPIHPGEMLLEEFLVPKGVSQRVFAEELDWTTARLSELIRGKRGVSAKSALSSKQLTNHIRYDHSRRPGSLLPGRCDQLYEQFDDVLASHDAFDVVINIQGLMSITANSPRSGKSDPLFSTEGPSRFSPRD